MTNGEITDEIKAMLAGGKLDNDDAMRLLLVMVNRIQQDVATMAEHNEELLERIKEIERYNRQYPSMLYMWASNPRRVLTILIIVALVYTLIVTPWMISDIRHVVLDLLGLPHDLGIGHTTIYP